MYAYILKNIIFKVSPVYLFHFIVIIDYKIIIILPLSLFIAWMVSPFLEEKNHIFFFLQKQINAIFLFRKK